MDKAALPEALTWDGVDLAEVFASMPEPSATPSSASSEANSPRLTTPASETETEADTSNDQPVAPNGQKVEFTSNSTLTGPLLVVFSGPSARGRAHSNKIPTLLYRTHWELAATLSSHVLPDQHVNHPEEPGLKLKAGNAFQSVGTLVAATQFTKERIERLFVTQMKRDPSALISTQPSFNQAVKRVRSQHDTSMKVPRRLFIAEIDVSGLVPAVLESPMKTIKKWFLEGEINPLKVSDEDRDVRIPIWILDQAPYTGDPHTRPDCTLDAIIKSHGLIWLSVGELMRSDLRVAASKRHENEWLAVSRIPKSRITRVMPFDGEVLHTEKGYDFVRSRKSAETFIWDFDQQMWRHNPDTTDYRPFRLERVGDKRKKDDDELDDILAIVRRYMKQVRGDPAEDDASSTSSEV